MCAAGACFVAGVAFWGLFNTALEFTNTEKFCTGCHEMKSNVYEELRSTVHFTNRSGVRATCPDCYVRNSFHHPPRTRGMPVGSGGVRANLATEAVAKCFLRDFQLVVRLQIHPQLRTCSEIACQPHRSINGYASPAADDIVETSPWNFDRLAHGIDAEFKRLKEIAFQDFSRVNRSDISFTSRRHAFHLW
jgi:NapC/NirT cytochrome c family protein